MSGHHIELPAAERDDFSFRPLASKHRIHELNLVGDDELIALLDAYPAAIDELRNLRVDPVAPPGFSAVPR